MTAYSSHFCFGSTSLGLHDSAIGIPCKMNNDDSFCKAEQIFKQLCDEAEAYSKSLREVDDVILRAVEVVEKHNLEETSKKNTKKKAPKRKPKAKVESQVEEGTTSPNETYIMKDIRQRFTLMSVNVVKGPPMTRAQARKAAEAAAAAAAIITQQQQEEEQEISSPIVSSTKTKTKPRSRRR